MYIQCPEKTNFLLHEPTSLFLLLLISRFQKSFYMEALAVMTGCWWGAVISAPT